MPPASDIASRLQCALDTFSLKYCNYLLQWQYDQPVISAYEHSAKIREAGLALGKVIKGVALNFSDHDFENYLPISQRSRDIIRLLNSNPVYDLGTYRTDTVFAPDGSIKFIEITCQFSLNAFVQADAFNKFSKSYAEKHHIAGSRVEEYGQFVDFISEKFSRYSSVCVIKGRDQRQSSRFYVPLLRDAGFYVSEISFRNVNDNANLIRGSHVINEFMVDEIESLSDDEISLISGQKAINDFRTILIAHDKRFFSLLSNRNMLKQFLEPSELQILQGFLLCTVELNATNIIKHRILEDKDKWIIKHKNLGRSRHIYAGREESDSEWKALLESFDYSEFVAQEWVPQKTYSGTVNGKIYNDYLTGTLLYFDDSYFGQGLYRASSHYIANKVDNRNASPLVVTNPSCLEGLECLTSFKAL